MALPSSVLGHPWFGPPYFSIVNWDGVNWTEIDTFNAGDLVFTCSIHPDENAVAIGRQHAGNLTLQMLHFDGANLTEAAGSPLNPTGSNQCRSLAFSPDGKYLIAGGNAATLRLYEWDGINLSSVCTYVLPPSSAFGIAWHPEGKFIAIAHLNQAANLDYLDIVEFDGSSLTLVARASAPVWLPQISGQGVSWRADGKFLAFSCGRIVPAGGDVRLFSWDGSNLTLLDTYQFGADYASDVDWHPSSDAIAVAHFDGDGFTILRKENNSLVYVTSDVLGPAVLGRGCSWRSDGKSIVLGKSNDPWKNVNMYSWDGANLILLIESSPYNFTSPKPRFFKYYSLGEEEGPLRPPDNLLCEQKKNPTDVIDPSPEFSAIHRGKEITPGYEFE